MSNDSLHRADHVLRGARTSLLALCVAMLQACGGGSSSSAPTADAPTASTPAPTPLPPAAPGSPPSTTLQVEVASAVGGTQLPFTVGQAFKQGDIAPGQAVVADIDNFQAVVKNRWPDGSVKFAILSGHIDFTANQWHPIVLSAGTASSTSSPLTAADLAATGVTASVQFGAFGSAAWNNAADWSHPVQTWVAGPQMSSFTYRQPLGSDAHLVAWLEVRVYRQGRVEVLPWLENGYLMVSHPTGKTGTASFTLGGTTRFSQSLTLANHQRAVLATGSALTHWYAGSDPQIVARHNTAYFMASKLVPNYRGATRTDSTLFSRLASSYTPLAQANFQTDMGATGYDAAIGLLPEWDAAYLTSAGDPRAYRAVLINGYAAGRYGVHYRDETSQRPLKFSAYPHTVIGDGSGVAFVGSSSLNDYTPEASGVAPPTYDSPHHPSMGYMAYLLSGWNYYLEENQLLATANFLKQTDTNRQFSKGVLLSSAGSNITRGAAWALRSLAQAAAITPDDDALRAEFVNSVDANIDFYYGRYVAQPNNPLGLVEPYDHYSSADPWQGAVWMDDFFTAAWGYMKDLGVNSASRQAALDAFLAWKYRSVVGRLGSGAAGSFDYRWGGANYTVDYAPTNAADWANGTGPWYADWGAVATAMGLSSPGSAAVLQGSSGGDPAVMATGYWGNLHPALAYAVDHGAAGALAAYQRLISASNYAPAQFDDQPVWGVVPR